MHGSAIHPQEPLPPPSPPKSKSSTGSVLEVVQHLTPLQQMELFAMIGNLLLGEGQLPPGAAVSVKALMQHANSTGMLGAAGRGGALGAGAVAGS